MKIDSCRGTRFFLLAGVVALGMTVTGWSQTAVWNGAGPDDNWSTDLNWQGGIKPGESSAQSISFTGTQSTSNMDYTSFMMNNLSFTSGAMSTLNGGQLIVYGAISAGSVGPVR